MKRQQNELLVSILPIYWFLLVWLLIQYENVFIESHMFSRIIIETTPSCKRSIWIMSPRWFFHTLSLWCDSNWILWYVEFLTIYMFDFINLTWIILQYLVSIRWNQLHKTLETIKMRHTVKCVGNCWLLEQLMTSCTDYDDFFKTSKGIKKGRNFFCIMRKLKIFGGRLTQ